MIPAASLVDHSEGLSISRASLPARAESLSQAIPNSLSILVARMVSRSAHLSHENRVILFAQLVHGSSQVGLRNIDMSMVLSAAFAQDFDQP